MIGAISSGPGQEPDLIGPADDSDESSTFHRPIVAFDFDGTLTTCDSFTAFLRWHSGFGPYAAGLAGLTGELIHYAAKRDRGRLKAAAARKFLGAASREEIETWARTFAETHARQLLRPDAVRIWKHWRKRNARLVIVTASPEEIVAPFARGLGADLLIGTRLQFDSSGRFTGQLAGPNCRGPEKVRRLCEAFGWTMRLEAAYGDTEGDREMLAMAEEAGYRVFSGKPTGIRRFTHRPRRGR